MCDNTPDDDAAKLTRDIETDDKTCLLAKLPPLIEMVEFILDLEDHVRLKTEALSSRFELHI